MTLIQFAIIFIVLLLGIYLLRRKLKSDDQKLAENPVVNDPGTDYDVYTKNQETGEWDFNGINRLCDVVESSENVKYVPTTYVEYKVYQFTLKHAQYKFLKKQSFPTSLPPPEDTLDFRYVKIQQLSEEELKEIVDKPLKEFIKEPFKKVVVALIIGGSLTSAFVDEFNFMNLFFLIIGIFLAVALASHEKNRLKDRWWD